MQSCSIVRKPSLEEYIVDAFAGGLLYGAGVSTPLGILSNPGNVADSDARFISSRVQEALPGLLRASAPVIVASGYSIKNKGSEAEIYLYGDVGDSWFGGVTAKQFADDLKAAGKVDTIQLHINSPGGDVFDGLAIYRLLVDHKAKVIVHIDGLAASIASVIAMAGDEIHMSESGFLMIHNAWGMAWGSSDDMRTMADLLDKTTGSIRDVYVARTGKAADKIKSWMDAETWFSAQEALDNGFVTEIADNMKLAAHFDPLKHKGFKHAPAALAGTPNLDAARERIASMKFKMNRRSAA